MDTVQRLQVEWDNMFALGDIYRQIARHKRGKAADGY